MSRISLLGVPIDAVTQKEAVAQIRAMLSKQGQHHVMTPNSEMLVEAHRNRPFHLLLQKTSLNLPDSAGLLWAVRWTGQHLPERVTGVDTVQALCEELAEQDPVFLLGAAEGIAARAAKKLQEKNPKLRIAGTYAGSPREEDAAAITQRIHASGAKLLLVAFGAPKQDMWIDRHLARMPNVHVAMGIGGTFDFLAGTQKRAPSFLRSLRLEWIWRLLLQPSRIGRIFTAVVKFPLLIMRYGQ